MPAPYSVPTGDETSNLYLLTKYLNGITPVVASIIGVVWIVAFVGSISEGRQASRAFIFASFISSLLCILSTLIGLLNKQFMYFSFLLVAIGLVWYKLDNAPAI